MDLEEFNHKAKEIFENKVVPQIIKAKMKQTAVEWLVEQLDGENHLTENEIKRLIQQAKEMELDQRKNDYRAGWNDNKHKDWNCEFYLEKHLTNFETFKLE